MIFTMFFWLNCPYSVAVSCGAMYDLETGERWINLDEPFADKLLIQQREMQCRKVGHFA